MVAGVLQGHHPVLYRLRSAAFLGRHNIYSADIRPAYPRLELLCDHGVAVPMVVLRVEVKDIDASHPTFEGAQRFPPAKTSIVPNLQ